jgi:peptidoglycan/LPS O-acetylase OafA/YrhL
MATAQRAIPVAAYRPDIDGLRAVAIGAVLLFHAFPKLFPGGFVGVDVFFVISGFLITGNITRGIESGSFTISGFYLRRVRRIFPALLLVLACCLIAGYILFTPGEFKQLGKHTAAAAGFASNFFYWAESGYFDSASISKPLLHLWSLGIEEQFYLLWPLCIVISQRRRVSRQFALAVFCLSFIACVLTTAPLSYGAFYSPATRMWELALGGVLALGSGKRKKGSDKPVAADWISGHSWPAELGSLGGIALIAAAVGAFDATTPYPGWKALLPTLGAGLVIAAGRSAFLNRFLLAHPLMVFVGLISYPLYLWHWPLLSFAHIVGLGIVPTSLKIGLLVASVVLAGGTYLLLEQPLHRTLLNCRLGGEMVAIMACLGVGGAAVYASGGTKWGAHSAADIANSRLLKAPDSSDRIPAQPPSLPSRDLEAVPPPKPIDSERKELVPAVTTVDPSKGYAIVGPVAPSRVILYRNRVADAMRTQPGNADAYLNDMWQSRLKATRFGVCEYADPTDESLARLKDASVCGGPVDGAKNIIVMGDSIGSDTYAWLHAAYPEYNIIQKTGSGCNLERPDSDNPKPCAATIKSALDIALSPTEKVDAVILASLWWILSPKDIGRTNAEPLIDKLLARGRKVVLVGPPVGFTASPRELIDRCPSSSKDGLTSEELEQCARAHSNVYREDNIFMKQYAEQKGLPYVDLHELACNDSACPILDDAGQLIYADAMHRSFPGDVFLARCVRQNHVFERILDAQ